MSILFRPLPHETLPFTGYGRASLVPIDIPLHQDEICSYLALPRDTGPCLRVHLDAKSDGFPGSLFAVDTMGPHEKGRGGYIGYHEGRGLDGTLRLWFSNLVLFPVTLGGAVLIEQKFSIAVPEPLLVAAPTEALTLVEDPIADAAIKLAIRYGGIDGDHHKAWVIDQMVRRLAGARYTEIVAKARAGEDGPESYEWNEGVAP